MFDVLIGVYICSNLPNFRFSGFSNCSLVVHFFIYGFFDVQIFRNNMYSDTSNMWNVEVYNAQLRKICENYWNTRHIYWDYISHFSVLMCFFLLLFAYLWITMARIFSHNEWGDRSVFVRALFRFVHVVHSYERNRANWRTAITSGEYRPQIISSDYVWASRRTNKWIALLTIKSFLIHQRHYHTRFLWLWLLTRVLVVLKGDGNECCWNGREKREDGGASQVVSLMGSRDKLVLNDDAVVLVFGICV